MTTPPPPAFVYRISTGDEWAALQRTGGTLGGDLDRSTGCFHLSDLAQILIKKDGRQPKIEGAGKNTSRLLAAGACLDEPAGLGIDWSLDSRVRGQQGKPYGSMWGLLAAALTTAISG